MDTFCITIHPVQRRDMFLYEFKTIRAKFSLILNTVIASSFKGNQPYCANINRVWCGVHTLWSTYTSGVHTLQAIRSKREIKLNFLFRFFFFASVFFPPSILLL
uniref:Uncharacterized protein n=1 Tax=Cacopsylla melanoneura TaxID=428564 RepID=A0A8D8ZCI7_9HEMI